jgi:hypothetical protein
LKEFVQYQYDLPEINILSVDHEFGQAFYTWLRTTRKCSHNTASQYMGFFKKIILSCIDNGWIQDDPFAKLNLTLDEVDPVFLTEQELQTIADKQISNERLATIRDIFIFSCLTSLCYIDVKQLKKSEVTIGHYGHPGERRFNACDQKYDGTQALYYDRTLCPRRVASGSLYLFCQFFNRNKIASYDISFK